MFSGMEGLKVGPGAPDFLALWEVGAQLLEPMAA